MAKPEEKPVVKPVPSNNRYILFIGNLPFSATVDQLMKHFKAVESVKSVRLLTDKVTKKPKGFAFLELDDQESYAKALAYHHTMFKNRQINVEKTAGGGGNSESRKRKLTEKNAQLNDKRKSIFESKISGNKKLDNDPAFKIMLSGPNSTNLSEKTEVGKAKGKIIIR
eukprot:Partr_v1_DN25520_c0_g1_i1_m20815 putative RNA binding protein